MRIRLSPQARTDLDAIWLYVATESGSPQSATRVISSFADKFGLFTKFPCIGKSLASELRPNVRSFPVNSYLIFYSAKQEEIHILRIIHASRDAQAVFENE